MREPLAPRLCSYLGSLVKQWSEQASFSCRFRAPAGVQVADSIALSPAACWCMVCVMQQLLVLLP